MSPRNILRWIARIMGVSVVALVLFFAVGEGFDTGQFSPTTGAMALALLAAMVGMLVLWRWELTGGLTVVISMLVFYSINFVASGRLPGGWLLPLFFFPGIIAVICWGASNEQVRPEL